MPYMGPRKFVCRTCNREFTRIAGDLVVESDHVCARCRAKAVRDAALSVWKRMLKR